MFANGYLPELLVIFFSREDGVIYEKYPGKVIHNLHKIYREIWIFLRDARVPFKGSELFYASSE
jgi:hypothetical protein